MQIRRVEKSCQRGTSTLSDRFTHSLSVNFGELPDQLGVLDCESDRLLLGVAEDDGSEQRRRGVVEVDDDVLGAPDSVEGTLDEIGSSGREDLAGGSVVRSVSFVFGRRAQSKPDKREGEPQHEDKTAWQSENHPQRESNGWTQHFPSTRPAAADALIGEQRQGGTKDTHLDKDVISSLVVLNNLSHKLEVEVGGGRVGDLNLLVANRDEHLEEGHLLARAHSW